MVVSDTRDVLFYHRNGEQASPLLVEENLSSTSRYQTKPNYTWSITKPSGYCICL